MQGEAGHWARSVTVGDLGPGSCHMSHGAVEQTETETAAGGGKLERWATLHCSPALN